MAGDFPFMFRDNGQNGIARSPEIVGEAAGAVFAERQKKKRANRVVIARGFVTNDWVIHDFNVINWDSSKTAGISASGPKLRFAAVQQDARNGGRTGRSLDKARTRFLTRSDRSLVSQQAQEWAVRSHPAPS